MCNHVAEATDYGLLFASGLTHPTLQQIINIIGVAVTQMEQISCSDPTGDMKLTNIQQFSFILTQLHTAIENENQDDFDLYSNQLQQHVNVP